MTVRIDSRVAWREIDGEVFVIDLRTKKLYGLSPAGGQVWRELMAGKSLSAVTLGLGGGSPSGGAGSVDAFVAELEALGLVTHGDSLDGQSAHGPIGEPGSHSASAALLGPPRIDWVEPLNTFGASCAFHSGQLPTCQSAPTT